MRKYNSKEQLEKIICNQCGKEVLTEQGLLKEDFISVDKHWGYFSEKDCEIHSFDLCESCYDQMIKHFQIMPQVSNNNEL